jgi:hypothetical protein
MPHVDYKMYFYFIYNMLLWDDFFGFSIFLHLLDVDVFNRSHHSRTTIFIVA